MSDCYPVEPDLQTLLESEARLIEKVRELTATVNGLAAERNALQRELHIARTKLEQMGRGDEPKEASRPK